MFSIMYIRQFFLFDLRVYMIVVESILSDDTSGK